MDISKPLFYLAISFLAIIIIFAGVVRATTIGQNIDTSGSLSVTGTTTIGAETLYVDPTTNRVGIGTVDPAEELSVNGQMFIDGDDTATSTMEGGFRVCNDGCTHGFNFYFGDATNTIESF